MKKLLLLSLLVIPLHSAENPKKNFESFPIVPIVQSTSLTFLTGYGSYQCYHIARKLDPNLYDRIFNITKNAVEIFIKYPLLMKAVAWKYERRVLSPEEMENARTLLLDFSILLKQANPALYMATGALAATSLFYAYQAVLHMYDLTKPISGTAQAQEELGYGKPFLLTKGNKILLDMVSYAGIAATTGIATKKCHTMSTLFEFDSWEIALDFVQSIMQDLRDSPQLLTLLTKWTNKKRITVGNMDKALVDIKKCQAILEQTPNIINIVKGALAVATLYGTYKMLTCGYKYFKLKQIPENE